MTQINLRLAKGREVSFEVELGLDGPAFFLLGVRRSGSTLFNNVGQALAEANRRNFVDASKFFEADIRARDWQDDPALEQLIAPGNVYGGFRDMPLALLKNPLFLAGPRLLLVRDPRDALVSLYFAMAYSHPIPSAANGAEGLNQVLLKRRERARSQPIDPFVVFHARSMAHTILEYGPIVTLPGTTLFHYEDVITAKSEWIGAMLAALGWQLHPDELECILEWADVTPEREDPHAFVRQVSPGDHRAKLKPETIEKITEILTPSMELLGYPV